MMRYLLAPLLCVFFVFYSCGGKVKKTWVVDDFSKLHQFSLKSPKTKTVASANIYLTGNFTDTIYMSKIENDSTMVFTNNKLPRKITSDFYGGQFDFFLSPSNAKGQIKIIIEINYY